jgi:hypothetical protein
MMNITYGIIMICVAVAMLWFAIPTDGISARFQSGLFGADLIRLSGSSVLVD